jgi:hypothetical protein
MIAVIISLIAGVLAVLFGYVSSYIVEKMHISKVPAECADWNKEHVMEKALFVDGFIVCLVMIYTWKYILN